MTKHRRFVRLPLPTLLAAAATLLLPVLFSSCWFCPSGGLQKNFVNVHGALSVRGNAVADGNGTPVALHGMSLFWSQWMGQYYNSDCIAWLRDDWDCTVVRAPMGVESGGYLARPDTDRAEVEAVINACIDRGIYVIVDWHDHNAHLHTKEAVGFFRAIAGRYRDVPNIIYEIYNEPTRVSWDSTVKPYAETVIQAIRSEGARNLVIVGTPMWSQDVDIASRNPIHDGNVAYALHFYAATHRQKLRDKAAEALGNGAALFASEFGTGTADGNGAIDSTELEKWFGFMKKNSIGWCNWSIADKNETTAALLPGADAHGGWPDTMLSKSGSLIRTKLRMVNEQR